MKDIQHEVNDYLENKRLDKIMIGNGIGYF